MNRARERFRYMVGEIHEIATLYHFRTGRTLWSVWEDARSVGEAMAEEVGDPTLVHLFKFLEEGKFEGVFIPDWVREAVLWPEPETNHHRLILARLEVVAGMSGRDGVSVAMAFYVANRNLDSAVRGWVERTYPRLFEKCR